MFLDDDLGVGPDTNESPRERTCPNYYERFARGPFCRASRMQPEIFRVRAT